MVGDRQAKTAGALFSRQRQAGEKFPSHVLRGMSELLCMLRLSFLKVETVGDFSTVAFLSISPPTDFTGWEFEKNGWAKSHR